VTHGDGLSPWWETPGPGSRAYRSPPPPRQRSTRPAILGLVALLSLLLLTRAFRSIILAVKALALNVLSVGASYGALVLIWQYGYGSRAIWGIPATGVIVDSVPLMVFAFQFGLSMDYEVFIVCRIREGYDAGLSTDDATVEGIARTGRLVTSAALILFLAFAAPDLLHQLAHRCRSAPSYTATGVVNSGRPSGPVDPPTRTIRIPAAYHDPGALSRGGSRYLSAAAAARGCRQTFQWCRHVSEARRQRRANALTMRAAALPVGNVVALLPGSAFRVASIRVGPRAQPRRAKNPPRGELTCGSLCKGLAVMGSRER